MTQHLRPWTAIALFLILLATPAAAQVVVLKMESLGGFGPPDANGRVTLTLASGTKIWVPLTDLDMDKTRQFLGGAIPADAAPRSPDDAYRTARCAELTRSPRLVPPETLARELRELQCGSPSAAAVAGPVPSYDVRARCAGEWKDDFQMRAFCEKQQQAALGTLQNRRMVTPDQQTIRTRCLAEWPQDYQMRNFCEEQQLKALAELAR